MHHPLRRFGPAHRQILRPRLRGLIIPERGRHGHWPIPHPEMLGAASTLRDTWGFAHLWLKLRVNNVDDAVYFYGNAISCPVMGTFFGANCVYVGVFSKILSQLTLMENFVFIRKGLGAFIITNDALSHLAMLPMRPHLCHSPIATTAVDHGPWVPSGCVGSPMAARHAHMGLLAPTHYGMHPRGNATIWTPIFFNFLKILVTEIQWQIFTTDLCHQFWCKFVTIHNQILTLSNFVGESLGFWVYSFDCIVVISLIAFNSFN